MRGGTSRGPFFLAGDLPREEELRDRVLLRIMGSPNPQQVDGLGGGRTVTSKAAIVSRSATDQADIDVRFAQVDIEREIVDTGPTCGNMLAAAAPFAVDEGMVAAGRTTTTVVIRDLNTGSLVDAVVQTPNGRVTYDGTCTIPGLATQSAPIGLRFRNVVGSKTEALLPTGQRTETIDGITVTCIDVAMPMVLIRACDVGKTGDESPGEIDADRAFMARTERIRRQAGERMGMGDVSRSVMPKVGLVSPPKRDGNLSSRYLTPSQCHHSYAVSGSICVSSAALLDGTVANEVAELRNGRDLVVRLEHPSGTLAVAIDAEPGPDGLDIRSGTVQRTARRLMAGEVYVPRNVWP